MTIDTGVNVVLVYDDNNKQYIQTYPLRENEKLNALMSNLNSDSEFYWRWVSSSMWVYSNKKQEIEYATVDGPAPLNMITLHQGWNLLTITPQMSGKTLNDIKGNCDIKKSYAWWAERQTWDLIDLNDAPFSNSLLGLGIIVKVSENCRLGTSESAIVPPQIPN